MEDNQLVIGGKLHIQFNTEIVVDCLLKGRQRVFRNVLVVEEAAVGNKTVFIGCHLRFPGSIRIDADQIEHDQQDKNLYDHNSIIEQKTVPLGEGFVS